MVRPALADEDAGFFHEVMAAFGFQEVGEAGEHLVAPWLAGLSEFKGANLRLLDALQQKFDVAASDPVFRQLLFNFRSLDAER